MWIRASVALVAVSVAFGKSAQQPSWRPEHHFSAVPEFTPNFYLASVRAQIVLDDGSGPKLVVAGRFETVGSAVAHNIATWDGVRFEPLGSGVDADIHALAVFDDGSGPALYAGGSFGTFGGGAPSGLVKWTGTQWLDCGGAFDSEVFALEPIATPSGPRLVVGGSFQHVAGVLRPGLALWDGAQWHDFPTGGTNGSVSALATFNGSLHVAGNFFDGLARWTGSALMPVGIGLSASGGAPVPIHDLQVWDDGSGPALFVAGNFDAASSPPLTQLGGLVRWDGTQAAPLGNGVDCSVTTMAGLSGELFLGGCFRYPVGAAIQGLARWDGQVLRHLPRDRCDDDVRSLVTFDAGLGAGPELSVGGEFRSIGGRLADHLARTQGQQWSFDYEPCSNLHSIADIVRLDRGNGPEAFARGTLRRAGDPVSSVQPSFLRWDGVRWVEQAGCPVEPRSVAELGGELFVSGQNLQTGAAEVVRWNGVQWTLACTASGQLIRTGRGPNAGLVLNTVINVGGVGGPAIAPWNGTCFQPLPGAFEMPPMTTAPAVLDAVEFDDGSGPALYVTGLFEKVDGVLVNNLARFSQGSWSAVGSGIDCTYCVGMSLETFDDGTGPALYVGGGFQSVSGVAAHSIARWDGTQWSALGQGLGFYVVDFAVFDDGAGEALYASSQATGLVTRWDGASWNPLGSGLASTLPPYAQDATLSTLELPTRRSLFAWGDFDLAGGSASSGVAEWTAIGAVSYCTAGTSAQGCVPTILATGLPVAGAASGFTLSVTNSNGQRPGMIFYGVNGTLAQAWGASSSVLCVRPPQQRTNVVQSSGTLSACDGAFAIDWSAFVAQHSSSLGSPFSAGDRVYAQGWYRDPLGIENTALSNALAFTLQP
ncbi:MAG: hypothetical protein NTV21_15655 [Planctomycetota bacterium]|nr:hypothetical protein [Planctomycetota bacterium]